jgi:excinuclease ABC subunit A
MGPEGGDGGGEIVAQGPPSEVVKQKRSHTGRYLADTMAKRPRAEEGKTETKARRK